MAATSGTETIATLHAEWQGAERKHLMTPSGNCVTIRRLSEADWVLPVLVGAVIHLPRWRRERAMRAWIAQHPEAVVALEDTLLCKALVSPRIAIAPNTDDLYVRDVSAADRKFLLDAIAEFAGVAPKTGAR